MSSDWQWVHVDGERVVGARIAQRDDGTQRLEMYFERAATAGEKSIRAADVKVRDGRRAQGVALSPEAAMALFMCLANAMQPVCTRSTVGVSVESFLGFDSLSIAT